MCGSKCLGGLGFKEFQKMNTALLSKQAWRWIQDPNSYWAQTLKGIYFPNSDFWLASNWRNSSWVWKSLIHGRSLLIDEGRWVIGTGQGIDVEKDNWLASGAKATLHPSALITSVRDLIGPNRDWDITKPRDSLTPHTAIEALKIPISRTSPTNYLIWPHSKDGVYSVKSGYRFLLKTPPTIISRPSTSTSIPNDIWPLIWNSQVPTKLKHFALKASHNFLPIRETLFRKKTVQTPNCPICLSEPGTIEHLFLLCPWTRPLWFGLQFISPPTRFRLTNFHSWLMDMCDKYLLGADGRISKLIYSL